MLSISNKTLLVFTQRYGKYRKDDGLLLGTMIVVCTYTYLILPIKHSVISVKYVSYYFVKATMTCNMKASKVRIHIYILGLLYQM
jgi:hypothetical protein